VRKADDDIKVDESVDASDDDDESVGTDRCSVSSLLRRSDRFFAHATPEHCEQTA